MNSFKLIGPLQFRVNEIEESLHTKELLIAGDEKIIYGTFEKQFEKFYFDSLRAGKIVNEKDFYEIQLNELNKIEQGVLNLESNLALEQIYVRYEAILSKIFKLKKHLSELTKVDINIASKQKIKRNGNLLSYEWKSNYAEINSLYKLLKENKIIDKKTKYSNFESVFKKSNLSNFNNPILWTSSNASELLYFIMQLIERGFISGNIERMQYEILKQCFTKENGEKFLVEFKSLKTDIDIRLSADRQDIINKILQQISN